MYTAENFKSDLKEVYKNEPLKALGQFKRIESKIKGLVKSFGFTLGKLYSQKEKGGNFVVHMPIIVGDDYSDEVWDKVDRPLSSDIMDIIDENKLDEIWGWEGTEESKKSPKNTIDLMVYLK